MRLSILLIYILLKASNMFAQTNTVYEQVDDFTVDQLGYIYIISKSGQLKKITATGDSVAVFNQVKKHGNLSHIDVSNPLKVLLFYKSFNTVVILDRLLNVNATLDLRKIGRYQVTAIGTSYDNNIWLYDEMNAELLRVDEAGNKIASSYSLTDVLDGLPNPVQLFDQQRVVYLYDPQKGVYQFDYFGGYKGMLTLIGWKDLFVWNDILYGRVGEQVIRYNLKTHDQQAISLEKDLLRAKKIYFLPQATYILIDDQLHIRPSKAEL
jgi:hypothetical protein